MLVVLGFFVIFSPSGQAKDSQDAIALRVLPNPEHYSIQRWYREKGFKGSPQSMQVDGYEAIRDGRTVYVSAANIDDINNNLYTDIYLISYNQEAENATHDVFGRVLLKWKFNTNKDVDSQCTVTADKSCLLDSDCPLGEYCLSEKAQIIRDTRRLADLAEIQIALKQYNAQFQEHPNLRAGTYLKNKTISTWPSWQATLGAQLGFTLPKDPINKLGDCGGANFSSMTCWDETARQYLNQDPNDPVITLPSDSRVYTYTYNENTRQFRVCAQMESTYANIIPDGCREAVFMNHAPRIDCGDAMRGITKTEFNGYVEARDRDGDKLIWDPITTSQLSGFVNVSSDLLDTVIPYQKRLYAEEAGPVGSYQVTIRVEDTNGDSDVQNCDVIITNNPPIVNPQDCNRSVRLGAPFSCIIEVTEPDGHGYSLSLTGTLPNGLTFDSNTGIISGNAGGSEGSYPLTVTATDDIPAPHQESMSRDFVIKTVTWCGDGQIQTPNGEGIYEECEGGGSGDGPDDQYDCAMADCTWTGGWCGNSNVEPAHEVCDIVGGNGTGPGDEWECAPDCQSTIGGYCGDGTENEPYEQCDNGGANGVNCAATVGYGEVCVWCDTNCEEHRERSSEFCGDGDINGPEECDDGEDNDCCRNCQLTCTPSDPWTKQTSFVTGPVYSLKAGESTDMYFPACSSHGTGLVDAVLIGESIKTAMVFVTDVSGSMGSAGMQNAKDALELALDNLHQAAVAGADIHIGLVDFGSSVSYLDVYGYAPYVYDISQTANYNALSTEVGTYAHDGITNTAGGILEAKDILDNFQADKKVIVLLTDGAPNDGTASAEANAQNAANEVKDPNGSDINIYTIAYNITCPGDVKCGGMCQKSSDYDYNLTLVNTCYTDHYSYSSADASTIYQQIITDVLQLPEGNLTITIGGKDYIKPIGDDMIIKDIDVDFSNISCKKTEKIVPFKVGFVGGGLVTFTNIRLDYCPFCAPAGGGSLPPTTCTDDPGCTADGLKVCIDSTRHHECRLNADGCLKWQPPQLCDTDEECSGPGVCIPKECRVHFSDDHFTSAKIPFDLDTVGGDVLGVGSYNNFSTSLPNITAAAAFNGIAIDENTTLRLYDGPNMTGNLVADFSGPTVIYNCGLIGSCSGAYASDAGCYGSWSDCWRSPEDMDQNWKNGSFEISCSTSCDCSADGCCGADCGWYDATVPDYTDPDCVCSDQWDGAWFDPTDPANCDLGNLSLDTAYIDCHGINIYKKGYTSGYTKAGVEVPFIGDTCRSEHIVREYNCFGDENDKLYYLSYRDIQCPGEASCVNGACLEPCECSLTDGDCCSNGCYFDGAGAKCDKTEQYRCKATAAGQSEPCGGTIEIKDSWYTCDDESAVCPATGYGESSWRDYMNCGQGQKCNPADAKCDPAPAECCTCSAPDPICCPDKCTAAADGTPCQQQPKNPFYCNPAGPSCAADVMSTYDYYECDAGVCDTSKSYESTPNQENTCEVNEICDEATSQYCVVDNVNCACGNCTNEGATRCRPSDPCKRVEVCEDDGSGCTDWSLDEICGTGYSCYDLSGTGNNFECVDCLTGSLTETVTPASPMIGDLITLSLGGIGTQCNPHAKVTSLSKPWDSGLTTADVSVSGMTIQFTPDADTNYTINYLIVDDSLNECSILGGSKIIYVSSGNSCDGDCTSDAQCSGGTNECIGNKCRNPSCPSRDDCTCCYGPTITGSGCPADQTVTLPSTVFGLKPAGISANCSPTYSWDVISSPPSSSPSLSSPSSIQTNFSTDLPGDYILEFTVENDEGTTDSCTTQITAACDPPVINPNSCGSDGFDMSGFGQFVNLTASVLSGCGPYTYQWTVDTKPPTSVAAPDNSTAQNTTFTPDMPGRYSIELTVTDTTGQQDTCTKSVNVCIDPNALNPLVIQSPLVLNGSGDIEYTLTYNQPAWLNTTPDFGIGLSYGTTCYPWQVTCLDPVEISPGTYRGICNSGFGSVAGRAHFDVYSGCYEETPLSNCVWLP